MNQLEKNLLQYKTNKINTLDIFFGSNDLTIKDLSIFNKNIEKKKFLTIFNYINYKN